MDAWYITLIKAFLVSIALLGGFAYLTLIQRRLLGRMQHRYGPNRVGPFGLLQPIADAIKAVFKEDIVVSSADIFVYYLAPFISISFALLAFGAIPAGPENSLFGFDPWVMDLDIGLLFVFAATSIGVYGIFLGGWAGNNKYSLLGSLRSAAQMISYELGLGLSALTVILITGSLNFREIVDFNVWGMHPLLWIPLSIAFVTYFISATAEVNNTPFDLPEAEQELVAGYLTEYSSIKWALYMMAEYVNVFTAAAVISSLFLGGWRGPAFLDSLIPGISQWPLIWLLLKMAAIVFVLIWFQATLPRLRYDQVMRVGWIWLFEIALFAAILTAALIAFVV